jgi:AhpC/TSA family
MTRNKVLNTLGVGLFLATIVTPQLSAQGSKPAPAPMKLKVGDLAPDFKLQYFDGSDLKDVTLSQYRGKKNVVLGFYIFAFTGG